MDGDIVALKHIAAPIVQDSSSGPASISDDLVGEICRSGAGELHCVAAVMCCRAPMHGRHGISGTYKLALVTVSSALRAKLPCREDQGLTCFVWRTTHDIHISHKERRAALLCPSRMQMRIIA